MRNFLAILMLIVAMMAVTEASSQKRPNPNFPGSFPGHPPWNPKPKPYPTTVPRFRRSPGKNQISIEAQKKGGSSSYNVDYNRKIYENKHGSISLNGGINKDPYSRPQKHIGISGSFNF